MTLDKDTILGIISNLKEAGYEIGLRDVSYVILNKNYADSTFAYKAIFGNAENTVIEDYEHDQKIDYLTKYMNEHFFQESVQEVIAAQQKAEIEKEATGLSYDEVKRGLENDLAQLIQLRDTAGDDIDTKEMVALVRQIADIRVKLTEKFGTTEKSAEQRVVVLQKFNHICPYCNHEIAIPD